MNDPSTAISKLVVERLHALVAQGYLPALGFVGSGAIYLRHPGKAPPVTLWADGQLLEMYPSPEMNDADRIIIEPFDAEGFIRFLERVQRPTLMQKIPSTTLGDAFGHAFVWFLFFTFVWIFGRISTAAYSFIKSLFN